MMTYNPDNLGEFQERERGHWFTYRKTDNPWALAHGLAYEVDVLDGIRFAVIKKTVAHLCTSEGDSGEPILEHWQFKKHHHFQH
jgi:hypothetical protein